MISSTGSSNTKRIKMKITILIDSIEYDTSTASMRVKGVNIVENKHIALGQSHTVQLCINRAFSIYKEKWDTIDLERISMASDPSKSADLSVIVMEHGLAHLCLITSEMTITKAKIEKSIPRKRIGSSSRHDKAILKFYDLIIISILRHIDFNICKCCILASPAFIKDDFLEYMMKKCVNLVNKNPDYKIIIENKHKFIKGHCSNGHKGAIKEVLSNQEMIKKLGDTKASDQTNLLNEFFKILNVDETRAIYGPIHVQFANNSQAIQTLMITDELFRSKNLKKRQKYVKIVEDCKNNGADIQIFSSLHVSGEQLKQITGIAAILRFPMPELLEIDVSDMENQNDDDSSSEDEDDDDDDDDEDVDEEKKIDG